MGKAIKRKILVIGCSSMGASIASYMCQNGAEVAVMDKNKKSFTKLSHRFSGYLLEGEASSVDYLKEVDIKKFDTVVVALDNDNAASFVSQMCKTIFKIKKVILRIDNTDLLDVLEEQGIEIINPTDLYLNAFLNLETQE